MTDNTKESLLKFPCDFTIKVIGNTSDEFEATVLAIIKKHTPNSSDHVAQLRPSANGKYQAVSVTFQADSRDQLDNLYRELSSSPLVIMAL